MGLDMYAYKTKAKLNEETDFSTQNLNEVEIAYWRKHPNLHGWMENLYYNKGGKSDSFNCVSLELTSEDLKELYTDLKERNLPETAGFFFGKTDGTEYDYDMEFVETALKSIDEGYSIYYNSWW